MRDQREALWLELVTVRSSWTDFDGRKESLPTYLATTLYLPGRSAAAPGKQEPVPFDKITLHRTTDPAATLTVPATTPVNSGETVRIGLMDPS
jgi:hypothetical protein